LLRISFLKFTLITLIIYPKSGVYILTYFIISLEYSMKILSWPSIINLSICLLANKDLGSIYL
jgi:hypothetical protein